MPIDKTDDISAHFDAKLAAVYEMNIRRFCPSYEALHRMLVPWLRELPSNATYLIAGAGTGSEILTLGRAFPNWRFTAVDASAEMLKVCQANVGEAGLTEQVDFFAGKMQTFQATSSFDAASAIFVSHFIRGHDEKLAFFRAVAANLKPGGIFILADLFGDPVSPDFNRIFETWLNFYASHGVAAEELSKSRTHIERDISFIPEEELAALLREAGFTTPVRFYQTFLFGGWIATKDT